MAEKVVEMKGITKLFPGTIANDNIDFELLKGETHVLLGENGAGKTTLMNILYGLYQADSGSIFINGRQVKITNSNEAIKLGIGMVHQHFMLINNFSVVENIILGKELKKGIKLDLNTAVKNVNRLSKKYGFIIDPTALIENISVGQQQKVEILKTLYRGAEILILDEPTAVLTPQEIDELAVIIDNLKKEGKSIILITHKLKEVMKMSDRVTIIRKGKVMGTVKTSETDMEKLAELMVGRKVDFEIHKKPVQIGKKILEVKDLYAKDNRGLNKLNGVNFSVNEGEILGIAGVDGNGQSELVEVLAGLRKSESGSVLLNGKNILKKTPRQIIESGLGHIPEDRQKRGLILEYSIFENSILGLQHRKPFSNGIIMNYKAVKEHSRKLISDFDVRTPDDNLRASSLSGGNQQKLVVGREILKNPKVLIASQPTRGLDVGAIEYIHKRLVKERDNGKAILLVSLELDEIIKLSDRIAVMYNGMISAILDKSDVTEQKLGILMAGGNLVGKGVDENGK